jgi:hypothetical protein
MKPVALGSTGIASGHQGSSNSESVPAYIDSTTYEMLVSWLEKSDHGSYFF